MVCRFLWLWTMGVLGSAMASAASPAVVVVIGGRQSCGAFQNATKTYMTPYLAAQSQFLRSGGADVTTISACIDARGVSAGIALTNGGTKTFKTSVEKLEAVLLEMIGALDGRAVAITGHSYGGDVALQLARDLSATRPVRFLATLDPISVAECRPRDFLVGANGCRVFPPDFPTQEQGALAEAVGYWRNIYQTGFARLHSGPAVGATNATYEGAGPSTHDNLARDAKTVQRVSDDLSAHWPVPHQGQF